MISLRQTLNGTGVALVTPFSADLSIDFDALGRVIDFVIKGQVSYLVSLGTTGETPTLTREEKISVLEFTYERCAGKVPVVAGLGGNDTQSIINDLRSFPLEKAVAILSASPYYNKPSQEGLYQHYKAIAEAAPKPVILYNVPGRTGRNLTAFTTIRLAMEVPNIVGIKEASGDMQQCMQILKHRPDSFLVVSGDDALVLPQIACGMDGIISVAANAFPGKFSDMVGLCLRGEFAKAKTINDSLMEAYDLMFAENNPAGVKAFMTEMGILENFVRLPIVPLSGTLHERVRDFLKL